MAVADVAKRRERAEHVPVVLLGAEIGFDAPQREQHPALDAEFLFHRVEGLGPFLGLALAVGDAAARGNVVDIGADRLAVFGLALGGRDHALIGRHAFQGEIESRARDALGLRVRPQRGFEGGEGLLLRARRRAEQCEDDGEEDEVPEHACDPFCVTIRIASYSSDTRPPPWRSSRPAISSSNSTVRTIAGDVCDSRTRSSIDTGVGPSRPMMRARSSSPGSTSSGPGTSGVGFLRRHVEAAPEDRFQHRDHVGGFGDQRRALLEQTVGSFRARIERRAGHRKHFAALFAGKPRGDQRAGAARRFHDHHADRQSRDQPVAARKVARARFPGERHFRNASAFGEDRFQQIAVLGRIDAVMAAGQHRDGAGRKTGAVGGGIDAARQSRHGAETGVAQVARQPLGEFDAGRRGVARADNGDQRVRQYGELAAHRQQRRRVVDHLQPRRIIRLAERDEFDAACARGFQFGFGVLARTDAGRRRSAAAPGERGQGGQRGTRAAVVIDEVAEGARPDIVGADEAQPVEPLFLAQSRPLAQRRPPLKRPKHRSRRGALQPDLADYNLGSGGGRGFCPDLAFAAIQQAARYWRGA